MSVKQMLIQWLGATNVGRWEYHLRPGLKNVRGGPFNGQTFRRTIFQDLVSAFDFDAIIETGTYRGITTKYMAAAGLPVHTVEASTRYLAFARMNFQEFDSTVESQNGDSRQFLEQLGSRKTVPGTQPFIYLDAHWYNDLPLREELEIVQEYWPDAVVMVDDFAVPGTNYGYDDYGDGKALTMEYLSQLHSSQLQAFFPSVDCDQESGSRRGCVVLGSPTVAEQLRAIGSLRYGGPIAITNADSGHVDMAKAVA